MSAAALALTGMRSARERLLSRRRASPAVSTFTRVGAKPPPGNSTLMRPAATPLRRAPLDAAARANARNCSLDRWCGLGSPFSNTAGSNRRV
jgi:hypothetical protein